MSYYWGSFKGCGRGLDRDGFGMDIILSAWRYLMKYKVNLKKTEEGYSVWVPGLPGCWSQGKTEKEALDNIKDAIQGYLQTVEALTKNKETRFVEVESYA